MNREFMRLGEQARHELSFAASLINRMANGDIEARNRLELQCRHVHGEGSVLCLPLDDLFLAFAESLAEREGTNA